MTCHALTALWEIFTLNCHLSFDSFSNNFIAEMVSEIPNGDESSNNETYG